MDELIMIFVAVLLGTIVFGPITFYISNQKGYDGGYWWGFFLGIIGVIVVACKPSNLAPPMNEYQRAQLAQITREQANAKVMGNGGWKCTKCGDINPWYTGTCSCGMTQRDSTEQKEKAVQKTPDSIKSPRTGEIKEDTEVDNLKKLKLYKELLDSGAITQEEYDAKKKILLS